MTNRRAITILLVSILFIPLIYWNDSLPFYNNSEQNNPQRIIVALVPFVGIAIGALVNFLEIRSAARKTGQTTED